MCVYVCVNICMLNLNVLTALMTVSISLRALRMARFSSSLMCLLCVCECVCMYVCMYVCMCLSPVCMHVYMSRMARFSSSRMRWLCVCVNVCSLVCMYICMYVCVNTYIFAHIGKNIKYRVSNIFTYENKVGATLNFCREYCALLREFPAKNRE